MGTIFASIASASSSAYERWQAFGPLGLAGEFLAVVILVFAALWLRCRTRSSVFWKRTDYAYFLFAILGGAAGAADLAINNWNKQLEQAQMNTITHTVVLRGLVSGTVLTCDREKEKADDLGQLGGRDVIRPSDSSGSSPSVPFALISRDECRTVSRIWSDIQNNALKTATEYGFETPLKSAGFTYVGKDFFDSEMLGASYWGVMTRIALAVEETTDGHAKEAEVKNELAQLSYFSILKSLSPILLGLGIGIRLARTHYDVKAEEKKAKATSEAA
jgi:hypothetical protein